MLPTARALFDFETEAPKELGMVAGQLVEIVNDGDGQKMWWLVRDATGATGFVPSNYLTTDPNIMNNASDQDKDITIRTNLSNQATDDTSPKQPQVQPTVAPASTPVVDSERRKSVRKSAFITPETEKERLIAVVEILERKLKQERITKEEYDKILSTSRLAEQLLEEEKLANASKPKPKLKRPKGGKLDITVMHPWADSTAPEARPTVEIIPSAASVKPTNQGAAPAVRRDLSGDDSEIAKAVAAAAEDLAKLSEEETARHNKRTNIFHEIVSTEEKYVETLRMLVDLFVRPLRTAAMNAAENSEYLGRIINALGQSLEFTKSGDPRVVIERQHVKVIFLEIESLFAINSMFLERLQAQKKIWGPSCKIGDVFLSMMSFFKSYTTFASNFEHAMTTIALCKRQPTFNLYLKHCAETKPECEKLWLQDHMMTPIQRIPRYIMLLRDLIKRTDETHPDYQPLSESLTGMEKIARIVNDGKARADNSMKLLEIQSSVKRCPQLVDPTRVFICEFHCMEMVPQNPDIAKKIVDENSTKVGTLRRKASYIGSDGNRGQTSRNMESMKENGVNDKKDGDAEEEFCEFQANDSIVLYLCNDIIITALHERVSSAWGRATENMKSIKGALMSTKGPRSRRVTIDNGIETIHKFKFQRSEELNVVTVSEFPDEISLKHGFVIHFPDGPVYYQAKNKADKDNFVDQFRDAASALEDLQNERIDALQRRFGGEQQQNG
eukprot:m.340243 g.340243  ORF g.340243 m.340243 type:complete len:728 (+) comp19197_c0_seq1:225-2408(+)